MSTTQTMTTERHIIANELHNNRNVKDEMSQPEPSSSSGPSTTQVAHTLTACTRCRQRKTRCDPGLPRCSACERTNSICEYYDSNKGHNVSRSYVVYLQHKVRDLEEELARIENEDTAEDPEAMMVRAANVRVHDATESKFLGPSSGIAITRLVMQLAKQFSEVQSIKEIVPEQRARLAKELYHQEQAKPTSKIYPLISNVAAVDLPDRALTTLLVQLYKLKVQPMYPALHEPTLDKDIDIVYAIGNQATSYQQFVCRMVIAISLQKLDTQYAGLADSYYLAALKHLEPVVKPMDLKTLQCFALMAEYSLLTPTRTAIFYVVGIAIRLAQALGLNEEKTITRTRADGRIDFLEIDMRRRLFWCIFVMECGLAHSLGRPCMLATSQEHIDVGWFALCDDEYITSEGIDPTARSTLKKWIAVHFFKMRLLQLEIRRKLYQRKRSEPTSDSDPWFIQMDAKLAAWRDAFPDIDEDSGLDKAWSIGRYNVIVVMLYRPSPQVPRPSLQAAHKCFDACEYNMYMHREQIRRRNVDLTWIFTQSIFMAINTMLWSLSYEEVRKKHSREVVERHLDVGMESIILASDRWPGVASAVEIYRNLIVAILRIYEKDGDVPIAAVTPSEVASTPGVFPDGQNRSQTTSPATVASSSVATPPERSAAPFGYISQQARRSVEQPPPVPYQSDAYSNRSTPTAHTASSPPYQSTSSGTVPTLQGFSQDRSYSQSSQSQHTQIPLYSSYNQFPSLPQFTPDLTIPGWTAAPMQPMSSVTAWNNVPQQQYDGFTDLSVLDPNSTAYPFPIAHEQPLDGGFVDTNWNMDAGSFGTGLNQMQQEELMHNLQSEGMEDIQDMISASLASITPKVAQQPTF